MEKYTYSVYDRREKPHRYIKEASGRSMGVAIAEAGFGGVESSGGKIEKLSTSGVDNENTRILIYLPESMLVEKPEPDFVMERLF